MVMVMKVGVLVFNTDRTVKGDASKLRGYISKRFKEYPILHHHVENGYLYTYPRVQYKIIERTPIILGIEEGADVLKIISDDIRELRIGNSKYKVKSIQMTVLEADFGVCKEQLKYKFLTPWLALNQDNYEKYKGLDRRERKKLLNRILIGNILSMCKGLNYVVMNRLKVRSRLMSEVVEFKGIRMIGFKGEFTVNFNIPDFFGIGKGVSHGFGTVKRA